MPEYYEQSLSIASFRAVFVNQYRHYEERHRNYVQSARIRSRSDRLMNPSVQSLKVSGATRIECLDRTLDSFVDVGNKPLIRHKFQVRAHKQFKRACLPLLLGDDIDTMLEGQLLENEWPDIKQQVLCVWPRRTGKSFSVAMYVVGIAMSCEGLEQSIFSTGRRASKKLLELILKFLTMVIHTDPLLKIEQCNQESIWIRGPHGPNDIRKISSYPSKVNIRNDFIISLPVLLGWAGHLQYDTLPLSHQNA